MANHPNIRVTDIETRLGTSYTAGSLTVLKHSFPATRFVWIMGADNLKQISRWHRWTRIFNQVPIAVFDRAPYSFGALAGKAARIFPLQAKAARCLYAGRYATARLDVFSPGCIPISDADPGQPRTETGLGQG